ADFEEFIIATVAALRSRATQTLAQRAAPLVRELHDEFTAALAGDCDDHAHLHQARIAGKRLRYAMEVFVDCFAPPFREQLYPLVEELQEILGNINDSHVAIERLDALFSHLKVNPLAEWDRLQPGADGLLRYHRERIRRERDKFTTWLEQWRRLDAAEPKLGG